MMTHRTAEFILSDMFRKIKTKKIDGKAGDFPTEWTQECSIPLLTAGVRNQGLSRYARREECPTILENVLSVSANGENSGAVFYQPYEFAVLQDAYAITLKDLEIPSRHVGLYLASALWKAVKHDHSWTNKAGWNNIKNDSVTLPITDSGNPDWEFMEFSVASIEEELVNRMQRELSSWTER